MNFSINNSKLNTGGFTVVELIIVIVVIGVLAALTVVGYSSIQKQSHKTNLEAALRNASTKLQKYNRETGTYPANQAAFDALLGTSKSAGINYTYVASSGAGYFCLAGTSSANASIGAFRLQNGEPVTSGNCSSVSFPAEGSVISVDTPTNLSGMVTSNYYYDINNDISEMTITWKAAATSLVSSYKVTGCAASTVANTGSAWLSCTTGQMVHSNQIYSTSKTFSVKAVSTDGVTESAAATVNVDYQQTYN